MHPAATPHKRTTATGIDLSPRFVPVSKLVQRHSDVQAAGVAKRGSRAKRSLPAGRSLPGPAGGSPTYCADGPCVVSTPLLDEHLSLPQPVEDLTVEKLVPQPAVEARMMPMTPATLAASAAMATSSATYPTPILARCPTRWQRSSLSQRRHLGPARRHATPKRQGLRLTPERRIVAKTSSSLAQTMGTSAISVQRGGGDQVVRRWNCGRTRLRRSEHGASRESTRPRPTGASDDGRCPVHPVLHRPRR